MMNCTGTVQSLAGTAVLVPEVRASLPLFRETSYAQRWELLLPRQTPDFGVMGRTGIGNKTRSLIVKTTEYWFTSLWRETHFGANSLSRDTL